MKYLGGSPQAFFEAAIDLAADKFRDSRIKSRFEMLRYVESASEGVTIRWQDPPVKAFVPDQYSVHQCSDAIGAAFAAYDKERRKNNPLRRLRPLVRHSA